MANQSAQQITPQMAAQLFGQSTRQHWQDQPTKTGQAGDTLSFEIPKTRLLSRVRLLVEFDLKVTHASATTYTPHPFAPFTAFRQVQFDAQNGFSPFKVSGEKLGIYSYIRDDSTILNRQTSGRSKVVQGLTASASGATNKVSFLADLPLTLNDRDPVGLVLVQNNESVFTVNVDIADAKALGNNAAGFTFEYVNGVKITPLIETFSIPAIPQAFPDISVLKLVHGTDQTINGSGETTVKLPTGMIYRKIAFYVTDDNGVGFADSELAGKIEIVFNQADTPYRINATSLAKINAEQFDQPLPAGLYVLDLSYNGIANYGGTRDYIDTESLTEFWLKLNPTKAGKIQVVYENLTQMTAQ